MWKKFDVWIDSLSASRIRDPILKFWFAGSGSGRKWTGSATLKKTLRFLPLPDAVNVGEVHEEDLGVGVVLRAFHSPTTGPKHSNTLSVQAATHKW